MAELIREKVFHLIQREVPYAAAVMVDKFTEHVYLGLFVRVRKNWRKDARVLAEFGHGPVGR